MAVFPLRAALRGGRYKEVMRTGCHKHRLEVELGAPGLGARASA
jgi:hypothetical protein